MRKIAAAGVHCNAMENIRAFADTLRTNIERVIVGKRETIDTLILALLCDCLLYTSPTRCAPTSNA